MTPAPAAAPPHEQDVVVARKRITLTHLDKVFYPSTGTTKAAVIDYYARIAKFMLPHVRDRAVTLKRYPDGVAGESFFEKACPRYRPDWIDTVGRFSKSRGRTTEYCLVNSVATLVWLANIATIEFHVPLAMRRTMRRPRVMVFDLDPGPGADVLTCVEVALIVKQRLRQDGLESLVKTSGSKGLQLYIPLNDRSATFDATKTYARQIAGDLAVEHAELIVANMRKSLRKNRVLIDWSQNDENKTTICAYSLRGRERPNVSTPVTWHELGKALTSAEPDRLVFSADDAVARADKRGDLFADVLTMQQQCPRA
jgi:bifunctional non-homologous end joining protein LigD